MGLVLCGLFGSSRQTTINSLHWLDQPTGLRIEAAPSEPKPSNPSVNHWSKEKHCLPPQENAVVKKLADHEIDQKCFRWQKMLISCSSTCRDWRNALDSADLKIFPSSSNQICITPEQYINEQVANLRKIQCFDTKKAIDHQRYQQSPQVPAEKQKTKSSNIRKNHFAAYDWLTKSSACYCRIDAKLAYKITTVKPPRSPRPKTTDAWAVATVQRIG